VTNVFDKYKNIKDRVCYVLIKNYATPDFNVMLKDVPHRTYLDFVIVYYVKTEKGLRLLITNKLVNDFGINEYQLFNDASINTPILERAIVRTIQEILLRYIEDSVVGKSINKMIDSDVKYVVTNNDKYLGATTVLYTGLVKSIATDLNKDLYIIFSSVHELIILDAEAKTSSSRIKSVIRTINETVVEPKDVMSDNLYRYCIADDTIKIVK
jgi:hypothetical protein